jgi:hypothetical protein
MAKDIEHFFMYLLTMCTSSFEEVSKVSKRLLLFTIWSIHSPIYKWHSWQCLTGGGERTILSAILCRLPVGRGVAVGSEKQAIFLLAFFPSFFSSFLLCW